MKTYFDWNKTSFYLTAAQTYSGKWAILTKSPSCEVFTEDTRYPLFDTEEQAEKYLSENFETCE